MGPVAACRNGDLTRPGAAGPAPHILLDYLCYYSILYYAKYYVSYVIMYPHALAPNLAGVRPMRAALPFRIRAPEPPPMQIHDGSPACSSWTDAVFLRCRGPRHCRTLRRSIGQ